MTTRLEELDKLHDTYRRSSSFDDLMRGYTFKSFEAFITDRSACALELGCADGQMTGRIAQCVSQLEVVEGSLKFLRQAQAQNLPNVSFIHALFEEVQLQRKYDYVFATYILTHIPDLELVLNKVRATLAPNGLFFVAVPNTRVLSRQLARHMGLLDDLLTLSENDKNHGHCRAYDRVRLNRDLEGNGFKIISQGGVLLKPLADFQMDQLLDAGILRSEQMDGLYKLGMEYPDLAGAIYAVCQINPS